jgi:threonine/homoserine/homoserine lactone efflux protein
MPFEHWLAFTAAAAILLAIPGPTVLLVVSYTLAQGRRASVATVAGTALGDFTAMTASMLGLGALLAASATLFTALKWAGAAYLVWLGIRLWRAPPVAPGLPGAAAVPARRMFLHAYAVTTLNPKSIVFFMAFLPQFLDTGAPLLPQMIVLETTFLVLATANAAAYALAAAAARRHIRRAAVQRAVNRVGGSLLIGAGVAAFAWRRT